MTITKVTKTLVAVDPKVRAALADKIFVQCQKTMLYLYGRWQDEKQYENIKDYAMPINKILAKHNTSVSVFKKKPFGFEFELQGATYFIFASASAYSFKRLK